MKKILIFSFFLLLLLSLPGGASLPAINDNPTINLTRDTADQIEYSIAGHYIAYTQTNKENYELYLYDISADTKQLIAQQKEGSFEPDLSNVGLAYVKAEDGKKNIMYYDLTSGDTRPIAYPQSWYHDTHPRINDQYVTFIRWFFANPHASLMIYNLDTQELTGVGGTFDSQQTNQAITDNWVVWQDNRGSYDNIYAYNFNTKEITNLSDNSWDHYFPSVSGDQVAWQSQDTIYIKNLISGSLQIIDNQPYANVNADIFGSNVVFQTWRSNNSDIYLYNTETKSSIALTKDSANDNQPQLSGDIVVWQKEMSDGSHDLYWTNLKIKSAALYTSLKAQPTGDNNVSLSWAAGIPDNFQFYTLYRSHFSYDQGEVIADRLTKNQYTDNTVMPGNTYYYRLIMVDGQGQAWGGQEPTVYHNPIRQLLKLPNNPAVYYINDNQAYIIGNDRIFAAWNFAWSNIRIVNQNTIDAYHYAGPLLYPAGSLLRSDDSTVYVVDNRSLHALADADTFLRAGYHWNQIDYVSAQHLRLYENDEVYNKDNFIHPDGTLIKYADSAKVYLLRDSTKHWITSPAAFNAYRFRWDRIFTIPTYWHYPDGNNL
ncbi:MAG: hypothetical protein ACKKL5_03460 [Candidatus Komeilibacteria bacterium]